MAVAEEKTDEAVRLQEAGRLREAEELFRAAVATDPSDYNAAFRLAVLYMHAGRNEEAAEAYQRLVGRDPRNAAALANFGTVLQALGRVDEAERRYREAIIANPALAAAHVNLGILLEDQGRAVDAMHAYRAALRVDPDDLRPVQRLATLLLTRNEIAEGLQVLQRWQELEPDSVRLAFLWGAVHLMRGAPEDAIPHLKRAATQNPTTVSATLARALDAAHRQDEALRWFDVALHAAPNNADLLADHAVCLRTAGRLSEAERAAEAALRGTPGHPRAHFALGLVRQAEFRHEAALAEFDRALWARPDDAVTRANKAASLHALGRRAEALHEYDQAVAAAPANADVWFNYGTTLQAVGRFEEARGAFRRARERRPGFAALDAHLLHMHLKLCDWRELDEINRRLIEATRAELAAGTPASASPFALFGAEAPFALKMEATRSHAEAIGASVASLAAQLRFVYAPRGTKLRVGYLSPDFRGHSAARLFQTLLQHHDRGRYELFGYSLAARETHDETTAWFAETFDQFRDVSAAGHEAAARTIHGDGIHVLVDLASHTRGARPEVLALRPAPVQCHYLGYNLPLGADWCRYLIGDPVSFADPALRAALPAELVMLRGVWAAMAPPTDVVPMTRAEAGLPDGAFVLANFSAAQKLEPVLWGTWMRVLAAVPHAVLWMLNAGETVRRNLLREADGYRIAPERIVWTPALPHADHVRRLTCADIALDTYYYKGGATALECLAAGVPVLTLTDPGPAWGASLCQAAGTPETIAKDAADYERIAIELARHPTRLAAIRTKLTADRASAPLFDPNAWARDVEAAYEAMWASYTKGAPAP